MSGDVVNRISVADFDAGQPFAILPNNADQQAGHTEYARPGTGLGFLISHEVSVTWMAEEDALGFDCVFTGHAFGSA